MYMYIYAQVYIIIHALTDMFKILLLSDIGNVPHSRYHIRITMNTWLLHVLHLVYCLLIEIANASIEDVTIWKNMNYERI
jgi:hypothetical protein